jgi:hypothetical protein
VALGGQARARRPGEVLLVLDDTSSAQTWTGHLSGGSIPAGGASDSSQYLETPSDSETAPLGHRLAHLADPLRADACGRDRTAAPGGRAHGGAVVGAAVHGLVGGCVTVAGRRRPAPPRRPLAPLFACSRDISLTGRDRSPGRDESASA